MEKLPCEIQDFPLGTFIDMLLKHKAILILNNKGNVYSVYESLSFQMVVNLLRTSLAALQTIQALGSEKYLKIAIDLVYIDIGLHNYNMIIWL